MSLGNHDNGGNTKQRANLLQIIKEAHQNLIQSDIAFWTSNMKALFERFPALDSVSWKQGFFYNDEYNAFQTTDFMINDLEIQENDFGFSPVSKSVSEYLSFKPEKVFLKHPENDKKEYEDWRENRKSSNEENTFMKAMKEKYAHLLPVAIEISKLINETYQNFGERHFADTFGKKALIIFNKEGLLVEDYEATNHGVLEDLMSIE